MNLNLTLDIGDLAWLCGGGILEKGGVRIKCAEDAADRDTFLNAAAFADNELGGISKTLSGRGKVKKIGVKVEDLVYGKGVE